MVRSADSALGGDAAPSLALERTGEDTILSVERAFAIVDMLADEVEGLSLAEISRTLGVNKGLAVKLLDTLVHLGIVWRDDRHQVFHLTYRISNLGLRQLQKGGFLDQCASFLKTLAETTGELVRLAVVEHGTRINWVWSVAGARRSVRIDPNYSLEISLNAHAIGKAWLSTIPFADALQFMLQAGIEARTVHTMTNLDALRAELALTSERGYAVSYQEQELEVGAIAAPVVVTDLSGVSVCVGAVSLAAPTSRMQRIDLEACAPLLLNTVAQLARTWPIQERPSFTDRRQRS